MSTPDDASTDETGDTDPVYTPEWVVTAVEVVGPHTLRVSHHDGTVADHDLSRLAPLGGVFTPLADPEFFAQARVEHGAVTWPGELDLAPDAMWDHAHGSCRGCGSGWTPEMTTPITAKAGSSRGE